MAEKATIMVLKVDLQCSCCYKKVKKLLCKYPQIRDQVYDEKQNTVTISVVCCSPEKIRDKLRCKGKKVIKSIEIIKPDKEKADKPIEKPKAVPEKPKEPAEKPKATVPEKPKEPAEKPKAIVPEKPKEPESNVTVNKPLPLPPPPMMGHGVPSIFPYEPESCCGPCSQGRPGGPCYYYGYRDPYCNDNYSGYGSACYNGGTAGRQPCYVGACDNGSAACTIM